MLSPNDRMGRVNDKIADYLENGVGMVWLAEPELRTVAVYRPGAQFRVYRDDEELTGEEVLPGLACRVSDLFYLPGKMAS